MTKLSSSNFNTHSGGQQPPGDIIGKFKPVVGGTPSANAPLKLRPGSRTRVPQGAAMTPVQGQPVKATTMISTQQQHRPESGLSTGSGLKKFKMSNVVTISGSGKASASQWKTVSSTAVKPAGAELSSTAGGVPKIPLNRIKLNSGMTPRTSAQAAPLSGQ